MNTPLDLSKRLLRLFSVRALNDSFSNRGNVNELIIEIADSVTPSAIKSFVFENLNTTKQHVYIFDLTPSFRLNQIDRNSFPLEVHSTSTNLPDFYIKGFSKVQYNVVLLNPIEEATLFFLQPYHISIRNRHLIIQATIMEKNPSAYFTGSRKVVDVKKINDENEIIPQILNEIFIGSPTSECDLTRGLKHLWDSDVLDCKYVKYKKSRSTTTEAMDENCTLKAEYPEVYTDLIHSPLDKTIFKYLGNDEAIMEHFTIDPEHGYLSFPLFPSNTNQINNVITQILQNN